LRKLVVLSFVSLDGVMQAPGGPEEDPSSGFKWGGWSVGYWDDFLGNVMGEQMGKPFDLLLGRKTYDIFAAHWPRMGKEDPVASKLNSARKYVVSTTLRKPEWANSTLIKSNVVQEIRKLKEQDDWLVIRPGTPVRLPPQGWKIHASATLDNADRVLDDAEDKDIGVHLAIVARPVLAEMPDGPPAGAGAASANWSEMRC